MTVFKIFKYPLILKDDQSIEIDGAIRVYSIVKQGETPVMYVLVDTEKEQYNKKSVFEVKIIGTGHKIEDDTTNAFFLTYEFVNTIGFDDDAFMYHFFVRRRFLE